MLPGRPPELDVNSAASLSTSDPAPQSSISGAVRTERESSTRTPSRALDAFSAAAGTGVSTRGGHSDRRTAAHRARRDIRSSRAVTRRTPATPSLDRPAGSNPMPDNAEWSIFWAAISACRSWVEPVSRYTAGPAPGRRPNPECPRQTVPPGLPCYGPNKEHRCSRDRETDRSRGQNCAVRWRCIPFAGCQPKGFGFDNPGSLVTPFRQRAGGGSASCSRLTVKQASAVPDQICLRRRLGPRWLAPFASACSTNGH